MASSASEPPAGAAGGRRPLIGLTTYRERAATGVWDTEFALLHSVYVDAVARAGGVPVLLPPQGHGADEAVERLDGLVLSGGSDVDPERYQQQPGRHTTVVRPWRDDWELRLLDRALAADLPVLGVCRGVQLLNVALGGTLDQHLPDTVGHQRHCPGPGVFGQTVVTLRPGSVLAGVLGPAVTVPCYHHQAIDKLAAELEVAARSADGTVEAVELPGRRFALGVQWHPEQDGDDLRLFAALVAAAAARTPGAATPAVATPAVATPGAATPESRTSEQNQGQAVSAYDVINPATEEIVQRVPLADADQADAAIARAAVAQQAWRAVAPADRARLLRRFSEAVDGDLENLARLEVANAGHTIGNARWEAGNVRDVLNYYAAAPERLFGRQIPVAGGVDVTFKEPLGVVGVIVPWNFPMPIAGWGFAPALAAGNSVVLKPAELTPLTAIRLGELALQAGLPEHVFQVIPGKGAVVGERFVAHPAVRKVVFTGSTGVGRHLMAGCAAQVKRVTLELGGKSANIVFADSDLERAAATAPYGVFDNAGQDCCARSRILVQRSAFDRFMELLEPAVKGVRVGDPGDEKTEMGPLISAGQRDTVASYVPADAPVAFRGDCPGGPGYWYPPTVLAPVDTGSRQWREEIFGPVVAVVPFDDEADAIRLANDSEYGLSGSIWTGDVGRAFRVVRGVESGNLSVNSHSSVRYSTPFGGFKQSGLGRELGPDAVDAFTETKNVFIATES